MLGDKLSDIHWQSSKLKDSSRNLQVVRIIDTNNIRIASTIACEGCASNPTEWLSEIGSYMDLVRELLQEASRLDHELTLIQINGDYTEGKSSADQRQALISPNRFVETELERATFMTMMIRSDLELL